MKYFAIASLLWLLLAGCDKASEHKLADQQSIEANHKSITQENYNTDTTGPVTQSQPTDKKQPAKQEPAVNPDWDKKIVKNGQLQLEVKDYTSAYTSFREKIKNLGGYVSQEQQQQSEYKIENTLVIKVPVDQFDNAMLQLTTGADKIDERRITSEDVTTEYIDTKSRIEAKRQVRERYIDLLKEAKNMEEILRVQSEINGVQEAIESASGRVNYLGHASSYSTISLTYYQVLNSSAKDKGDPSFGTKLSSAFKTGGNWLLDLFVGLVSIWPLLIAGALIFLLFRRVRTKNIKA